MTRGVRPARRAWLAGAAALLATPTTAFAATPPGTAGGSGEIPPVGFLDQMLAIVWPLAALAVAILVLGAIGIAVARIGGAAGASLPPTASRRRTSARREVFAAVAIGAGVAGVLVGREIASEESRGLFLAGVIPTFFLAVIVAALGLIGLIAIAVRRGVSPAIAAVFAAAVLLAGGAVVGKVTASATGGIDREAVVLEAPSFADLRFRYVPP